MRQSTTLIVNATVTYLKMGVGLVLGLVTVRLLLDALGVSDYGIYAALGAGISLLMLIQTALAASTQRHLAFQIGRRSDEEVRAVFSTSFVIYAAGALLILSVGLLLGPPLLAALSIPDDRAIAAAWVYYALLISMAFTVFNAPYAGLIIAQQELVFAAVLDMSQSLGRLLIAIVLFVLSGDRLIAFGIMLAALTMLVSIARTAWCLQHFKESRPAPRYVRRKYVRELVGFAVWAVLGNLSFRVQSQLSMIVLNVFFGTRVNAGWGVAVQASASQSMLSSAIDQAVSPAMTTIEGAGNRDTMIRLASSSSRLSTLAAMSVAIPAIAEAELLMRIWLHEPPPFSAIFVSLLMAAGIIAAMSRGQANIVLALGNIRGFVLVSQGILLLALPLGIVAFWAGLPPMAIGWMVLLTHAAATLPRVAWAHRMIGAPVSLWFTQTLLPLAACIIITAAAVSPWRWFVDNDWIRLGLVTASSIAATGLSAWYIGTTDEEHSHVRRLAIDGIARARRGVFGR